jgi:hypothetical protein
MQLNRYFFHHNNIYKYEINKFGNLKFKHFGWLQSLKIVAGLFTLSEIRSQHILLAMSLIGKQAQPVAQLHRRKQYYTGAFEFLFLKKTVWELIDKFVHEIIPVFFDFLTPKFKKGKVKKTNTYTWHVRYLMKMYDEFNLLLIEEFYKSHRGIFLPLHMHFTFSKMQDHFSNECYFHMLRYPFWFYKKKRKPTHDDFI